MSQHIYTYDPVNGLEEIGGAGHIIKDANGTAFSKRENLQFEGASIADDSTNNATVVTITETNFVGTYAQWNALTSAQKAQYKTVDLIDDFGGSPIDSSLSTTSENPVQNKVITVPLNKTYKDDDTTEATLADGDYFPFYDVSASAKRKTLWSNIVSKIKTALSIQNVLTSTDSTKPLSANMGNALGKMVAPIESSSTASRAYSVGSQFVYNGILYKATAAISSGGNINPGGNCTPAPSVTAQISDLSNVSSTYIAYGSNEGDGFYLYRSNNMKVIQIHMTIGVDKPDGTVFVTIPSEFCPSVSASYDMQIIDPTNHSVLGTLRIGSNGQITSLFTTFKAGRIRTFASYI